MAEGPDIRYLLSGNSMTGRMVALVEKIVESTISCFEIRVLLELCREGDIALRAINYSSICIDTSGSLLKFLY